MNLEKQSTNLQMTLREVNKVGEGQKNVPKLRFKGYEDAWEQRKLHECADFRRGSFPQPYGNKEWFDGKGAMPFVQVADVTDDMKLVQNTKQQISKLAQPMSVLAERGSVLVTLQGSIGRVAISQYNAFIDRTILVFDNYKIDIDKSFCAYVVKGKFADEKRKAPGGTIKTITKEVLSSFDLVIPSFNEQEDIGEFLVNLDQLITLHQRKYDALKSMKKTLLSKMFPKNGEDVPEIRFKGYTDAWEQRKAGDLLIERNEQAPMSIEYPLMAFIANEGVAPKGERYDRSALVTDTENKLYKRTEFGDFIYSSNNLETGSIGLNKYGKACISPVYSIFQPTGIADSDFLGRRLVRKDFINSMVKWRQGVVYGQWRIHESDFLKIEIHVPSVEEQRQIGTYLDYFDHLITLHQRKLDELKNMKKTLLQQMFV